MSLQILSENTIIYTNCVVEDQLGIYYYNIVYSLLHVCIVLGKTYFSRKRTRWKLEKGHFNGVI